MFLDHVVKLGQADRSGKKGSDDRTGHGFAEVKKHIQPEIDN